MFNDLGMYVSKYSRLQKYGIKTLKPKNVCRHPNKVMSWIPHEYQSIRTGAATQKLMSTSLHTWPTTRLFGDGALGLPPAAEPKQFLSGQHQIRVATVAITDSIFHLGMDKNAVPMASMD